MKEIQSIDIALEQLETALRLYKETEEYISVITLAGAAEEILGKVCREQDIENSLEQMQRSFYLIRKIRFGDQATDERKQSDKWLADRANSARNKAKHANPVREPVLTFDVKEEAKDLLGRALDNWWALGKPYSPTMLEFHNNKNV
ncbi:MAG: hypothetical protein P1U80_13715 [Pseudomonadales bacterium]|nr:hypothetical protein [Pseudomonadales bacterium]